MLPYEVPVRGSPAQLNCKTDEKKSIKTGVEIKKEMERRVLLMPGAILFLG